MKNNGFFKTIGLIIFLVIIITLILLAIENIEVPENATKIRVGKCEYFESNWEVCHIIWVKNVSYIEVSQNGVLIEKSYLYTGLTADIAIFEVKSMGIDIYVNK
jgi:hypothetical protein